MHDALHDELAPVLVRWTMGGSALSSAPARLRGQLGDDADEAELRLLAYAGQALAVMVVPEPSGDLTVLEDIPTLDLPTIPDRLRPNVARAMEKAEDSQKRTLLQLLVDRGRVVHPSDWMPPQNWEAPAVYAPWQDWSSGASNMANTVAQPEWGDLGPAGRRALLRSMRRSDPEGSRGIMQRHIAGEGPEMRLRMVEEMAVGLTQNDQTLLEGIASTDRAPRVKAAAVKLLSRMGVGRDGDQATASDMKDFFRLDHKGLLKRTREIVLLPVRNNASDDRRIRSMESLSASHFAGSLGIAEDEIPALWPWATQHPIDRVVMRMLLETGSDSTIDALRQAISRGARIEALVLPEDPDRLGREAMIAIAMRSLGQSHILHHLSTKPLLAGGIDDFERSVDWKRTIVRLKEDTVNPNAFSADLLAIGLLATKRAASALIDRLGAAGMPTADPRLDVLHINAEL